MTIDPIAEQHIDMFVEVTLAIIDTAADGPVPGFPQTLSREEAIRFYEGIRDGLEARVYALRSHDKLKETDVGTDH